MQIVDAQAARFGDFDDVQVMGLVEGEWPERPRRNMFYPQSLLAQLEPARPEQVEMHRERDMLRAGRAAFRDLLGLAKARTRVSTFALESDAVVEPSVLLDDLGSSLPGCPRRREAPLVGRHLASGHHPIATCGSSPGKHWRSLRKFPASSRADGGLGAAPHRGHRSRRRPLPRRGRAWTLPRVSVSRLERYLKCPFQFYATNVLQLDEEPEDED